MTLIARLSTRIPICRVANDVLPLHCRSSWRHAVPRIMIQSTATKALDWHRARSRTNGSRPSVATSRCSSRAKSRNVADATTMMAFLIGMSGANTCIPQAWAVRLNMSDPSTAIALLRLRGARRGTSRTLVARLTAIIAKSFSGLAVLCVMTQLATFEATLSQSKAHLDTLYNTFSLFAS